MLEFILVAGIVAYLAALCVVTLSRVHDSYESSLYPKFRGELKSRLDQTSASVAAMRRAASLSRAVADKRANSIRDEEWRRRFADAPLTALELPAGLENLLLGGGYSRVRQIDGGIINIYGIGEVKRDRVLSAVKRLRLRVEAEIKAIIERDDGVRSLRQEANLSTTDAERTEEALEPTLAYKDCSFASFLTRGEWLRGKYDDVVRASDISSTKPQDAGNRGSSSPAPAVPVGATDWGRPSERARRTRTTRREEEELTPVQVAEAPIWPRSETGSPPLETLVLPAAPMPPVVRPGTSVDSRDTKPGWRNAGIFDPPPNIDAGPKGGPKQPIAPPTPEQLARLAENQQKIDGLIADPPETDMWVDPRPAPIREPVPARSEPAKRDTPRAGRTSYAEPSPASRPEAKRINVPTATLLGRLERQGDEMAALLGENDESESIDDERPMTPVAEDPAASKPREASVPANVRVDPRLIQLGEEWVELRSRLGDVHLQALRILLADNGTAASLAELAKSAKLMPKAIIAEVNDAAAECLEDQLIDDSGSSPRVFPEYRESVTILLT